MSFSHTYYGYNRVPKKIKEEEMYNREGKSNIPWIILAVIGVIAGVATLMFALPMYKVWRMDKVGAAKLAEAKQTRQIMVEAAQAELDASKIRAQAIGVIGQAAKDFPEYRLQEFLGAYAEALQSESIDKIIFVATEGGIPIVQNRADAMFEDE